MFREKAFNCFSVTMVKELDSCVLSAANSVLLVVGSYRHVVCYGVCVQCCMHAVLGACRSIFTDILCYFPRLDASDSIPALKVSPR